MMHPFVIAELIPLHRSHLRYRHELQHTFAILIRLGKHSRQMNTDVLVKIPCAQYCRTALPFQPSIRTEYPSDPGHGPRAAACLAWETARFGPAFATVYDMALGQSTVRNPAITRASILGTLRQRT